MSGTVAEFMQKPVKKYACGKKAPEAKKTLMRAFVSTSKKNEAQEKTLFEEMISSIMKTGKGRETMTELSELGYTFHFEKMEGTNGFCLPNQKKILLDPQQDFYGTMHCLVHEGRHAIQSSLAKGGSFDFKSMKAADYIKLKRAMEADASAHEMAFLYQCEQTFSADPRYQTMEFRDFWKNTEVYKAYAGEMEKSGDEKKAMQVSFAAWYKDDFYMNGYENLFNNEIRSIAAMGKNNKDAACFSQDYPTKDVLRMLRFKGKPYVTEQDIMTGVAFSLSEQHKREMETNVRDYAQALGIKADTSLSAMYVRSPDGTLSPEKKAVNAAVVAKAKREGR